MQLPPIEDTRFVDLEIFGDVQECAVDYTIIDSDIVVNAVCCMDSRADLTDLLKNDWCKEYVTEQTAKSFEPDI